MLAIPFQPAQALTQSQSSQMLWLTLLMAAGLIALGVVAMLLRRWIHHRNDEFFSESGGRAAGRQGGEGLGFSELRQMHAQGQLTDEEFAKAKEIVLKQMHRSLDGPSKPRDPAH